MAAPRYKLSIVCPAFEEEEVLPRFHADLRAALSPLDSEYDIEILYIDDGSRDGTLAYLRQLADNDPRIRNDLLLILGNQNYESVSKLEGKEELRKRCLDAVRTVVKDSGGESAKVEALYFTSFVMQ